MELIPNIIHPLIIHRKKIVAKASKKTKKNGKGSHWGCKKRHYLSRQAKNVFLSLQYDEPEWKRSFGLLKPQHVKKIAITLKWDDQRAHKLDKLNRVLLWIYRLRKATNHSENSLLFGISISLCSKIFKEITLQFINSFKEQIQLPFSKNKHIFQKILMSRGEILPQHIYALDGKHVKKYGGRPDDYSFKLKKKARNGLFMVNRATGKIDYMSINYTGTTHDITAWENCSLMKNDFIKNAFFEDYTIIADLGFQSKKAIGIYTPGYKEGSNGWKKLNFEQKKASEKLRKAQKNIENTFARIFFNAFKLCENLIGNDINSLKQANIIHASVILHNLTIEWTKRSIFDDEYQRLSTKLNNVL